MGDHATTRAPTDAERARRITTRPGRLAFRLGRGKGNGGTSSTRRWAGETNVSRRTPDDEMKMHKI